MVNTRSQDKAKTTSETQAHGPDSGPLPSVAPVVAQSSTTATESVSGTSSTSATVRARTLAAQVTYARKLAEADARAREADARAREADARAREADARAEKEIIELELKAEIAKIEAESASRRGSSRSASTRGKVDSWLDSASQYEATSFKHTDVAAPADLYNPGDHATACVQVRSYSPYSECNNSKPLVDHGIKKNNILSPFDRHEHKIYSVADVPPCQGASGRPPSKSCDVTADRACAGPTSPEPCCDPARGTPFSQNTFSIQNNTKINQASSDIKLLAQAIQSLAKDKSDISLPNFNGNSLEWLAFKRAYDSSKDTFSVTQNHSRINKALRGAARDVAGALLATAHDPEDIMSVLDLHFGRPELIVLQEVASVRALPRVYSEGKDFHYFSSRVRSCVSVLKFLNNKSYLESPELYNSLLLKLSPAIRARWKDYAKVRYTTIGATKLELLSDFLSEEVTTEFQFGVVMEGNYTNSIQGPKKFDRVNNINYSAVHTAKHSKHSNINFSPKNNLLCLYCHQEHTLENCDSFIQLDSMARWNWARDKKICHRCLKKGLHRYRFCKYNNNLCEVKGCKYKHHKLLHVYETENVHGICEPVCTNVEPTPSTSNNDIVAHAITRGSQTFLKIIAVTVSGPKGSYDTYALLDDGSSSTFIDREVATKIGATGPKSQLQVKCVNGLTTLTEVEYVEFYIKGTREATIFKVQHARSIPNLGITRQTLCSSDIKHLALPLSLLPYENVEPKVIIGIDNWHLTIPKELRKGSKNQPVACLTALGWVVFGFSNSKTKVVDFINHISTDSDIENIITDNYKLESLGILKQPKLSILDERAENILKETARRLPGGQFVVGLLWKSDKLEIPNSYPLALSRFINLEKRFAKDKSYAEHYRNNINAMIEKGYAERCDIPSASPYVWYLPHFGVTNVNKPGKLRVVHDAAARCQGVSLNSLLLTGPDLLQSLLYIIFRFREGRIGMTADIREMFPQIKIRTQDRDAQRFLWRESPDMPISTFRMSSMIFGAASSPFTALYIKNKNAEEHKDTHPLAVKAIIDDTYMDDYIGSMDSVEGAAELVRDIVEVHSHAHFEIRSWISNDLRALSLIPPNLKLMSVEDVELGHFPQSVRTLGIMWDPSKDELGFNVTTLNSSLTLQESITKRQALSTMMKVFDPLGIIAPVTIRARIIFQVVWRRKIAWDVDLPQDLKSSWKAWLEDISKAINLRIPRWHLIKPNPIERELHVFCDASENAFASVAYWRFLYADGDVQLSLICSKSRVTPLTPVSISRLELQAALIASRLASSVCEAHKHKPIRRYFWTDSKNVLGWLRNDARSFLPFVANRISEILETTSLIEWHWVPTAMNVADDATRDKIGTITINSRWVKGPEFLKSPPSSWPQEPYVDSIKLEEVKPSAKFINVESSFFINADNTTIFKPLVADFSRFSNWFRFLRSTARAHQFIHCLRSRDRVSPQTSHTVRTDSTHQLRLITANDLRSAKTHIFLQCQEEFFPEELAALRLKESIPYHSKVIKYDLMLGSDGLIRLAGRIGVIEDIITHSNNPILLDSRSGAVKLLIAAYHRKLNHANNETVISELRQEFWILKLRSAVRSIARTCQWCRIKRAIPCKPLMGNLPKARLAHHRRPFSFVGLDYFGPILITVGRRHEKRYVALYTCLTTRAVHLEVVHDLSTDAALMSLRRFVARRGLPVEIWSDNGTAFVGASKFLRQLYGPPVEDFAANENISWNFIPPSAPSMGGAWERLVRSVKTALKATLTERYPKEAILTTLLAEAEAIVNSRPLTHVSADPDDDEALTPFHFLIGSSSTANHFLQTEDRDLLGRAEWRKTVRLADIFWKKWIRFYMPSLIARRVDRKEASSLAVGDLVLVVDSNLPRGTWPRGRVSRVFPGTDGIVRVAEITTAGGTLRRPCVKLVRLPVE